MWKIPLAGAIALFIDWRIFKHNTPANQPKPYHPNFRIWGLGLVAGIGTVLLPTFNDALAKQANPTTWHGLLPLFFTTAAIGLIIWAIVDLCKSE